MLALELREWDDPDARRWRAQLANLRPAGLRSSRKFCSGSGSHPPMTPNGSADCQRFRDAKDTGQILFELFDAFLDRSRLLELFDG
jgi:hypothetical protein